MSRGVVCLTFDFDAISLWLARGAGTPGPISRGEFGAVAVPRILDLLRRKDIHSTFYIPGHTLQTYPDLCRTIHDAGHEVALHGDRHEVVSKLTAAEERAVNEKAIDLIERLTGRRPVGHRTPSFDFSANTVPILQDLGILYDSSLMGTDHEPYLLRHGDRDVVGGAFEFGAVTNIVELPVSWTLDDYPHLEFYRSESWVMPGLQDPDMMFGTFLKDVRYMTDIVGDGVLTITLHPQVIGRGARMAALERFVDNVSGLGAGFVSCEGAARSAFAGLSV